MTRSPPLSWSPRPLLRLALLLCLRAAAAATCGDEFLSGVHNPYRFCSSVVDYSYVIADGSSADAMNTAARALAERYYVEFFPTACKESLKRSICAQTYVPCDGGVALKKPCVSLCEATAGEDGVCNGLMELFGYQPDCADSDTFDASNDPDVCNALTNVEGVQLVADRNEPYVGSVCANYVEYYFVPEASAYYAPLAPMPLPNLFQGYQEASAADWISKMPKFESEECNTAFHKVACATIFMKPQTSEVISDTFGSVHFPQFPARELCTDYADKCSWILNKAPTLGIDCTTSYPGWDGNAMYLYPEHAQYVRGVMYKGAWTLMSTDPNRVDTELAESTVIEPQCPHGTVHPKDASISGISYATPGCAVACPLPVFTDLERDTIGHDLLVFDAIGFVLMLWVLVNNVFILKKKANGFIVSCVVVLLAQFSVRLAVMASSARDGTDVCSSDATYFDRYDPDHEGWNSCVAFASQAIVGSAATLYIVSVLNAEMWFKIRYGMKDVQLKTHKLVIRSTFAVLITAWTFAFMFGADVNIYHGSDHYCAWRADDNIKHFWAYDFVVILIVGFIVLVDIALAYTMIKMSSATGGNSIGKIWKSYKYIFGLMLSFMICWLVVIGVFYIDVFLIELDSYVKSMDEYYTCLFANFVSEDDREYLNVCGYRPGVRYPLYGSYLVMVLNLFVAVSHFVINYWSAAVSKFYLGLLDSVFRSSIATRLMPKSTYECDSKVESKMESSVELQERRKSVFVITPQLKNSKVVPVVPIEEEQCTHRSDDSAPAADSPLAAEARRKGEVDAIREVDEAGQTVTNGGGAADNV